MKTASDTITPLVLPPYSCLPLHVRASFFSPRTTIFEKVGRCTLKAARFHSLLSTVHIRQGIGDLPKIPPRIGLRFRGPRLKRDQVSPLLIIRTIIFFLVDPLEISISLRNDAHNGDTVLVRIETSLTLLHSGSTEKKREN